MSDTNKPPHQWRTREEWAEDQHAFYHDRFDDLPIEFTLTDEEVQWAVPALRELWKTQGRLLRELAIPPALRQQPGETIKAFFDRCDAMPQADQDLLAAQAKIRWIRQDSNKAIKALKAREASDLVLIHSKAVNEILAPILARYQAAKEVATEKRKQEILARPIDDAAWARELEWRAGNDERRRRRNL
jgi:hypothetical protein